MSRCLPAAVAAALLITSATLALPTTDEEKVSEWHEVLPATELNPFAEQITAALKKPIAALAGGKLDDDDRERAVKKARGLALLLAAGAQASASKDVNATRLASINNAAMQLDRALLAGKFSDAQAILAALPIGKGFEKPPFATAALASTQERDDALTALMMQFRLRAAGGLGVDPRPAPEEDGLEVMLKRVADQRSGLKPDEVTRFAYRLAVLAEATRSLPPPRPRAGKDPAKWLQWAAGMRTASLELAEVAGKKDRVAIRQAALRIARSCSDCHKMFRDN